MLSRRILLLGLAGGLAGCSSLRRPLPSVEFLGDLTEIYTGYRDRARGNSIPSRREAVRPPSLMRQGVPYKGDESPGTILVSTSERRLYLILDEGMATVYPVGVGKAGKQWQGRTEIDGAYVEPAWAPTADIRRDNPALPDLIPGGAPENPMGARVLTLSGGKYAIHGTNRPESIGTYASYGCVRMFNEDVIDLFRRVGVGTPVIVAT
jgi:lipoprotein-anchoring transpeptidase ErfK/SrfK